jgi:2-amino-4-hydroxy-6-hydroxymethyldihydropteridine diphosphokinase
MTAAEKEYSARRTATGHLAFVLLGSNIDKEHNLPEAVRLLGRLARVVAVSTVYETAPVAAENTPDFFNAAVLLETELTAAQFRKDVLGVTERELGRVRTADKNAPRTIDIDLILFNRKVFDLDPDHHIPDPELLRSSHVAVPIAELDPLFLHPETGESLAAIAHRLVAGDAVARRQAMRPRPDIQLPI